MLPGWAIVTPARREHIERVAELAGRWASELAVRSEYFTVWAGMPVRVPLADQGSWIEGPLPSKTADRRPDGTLITASVPQAVMLGR